MDWPKPPIWPDDLHDVRELLTDEEWEELLRRHWSGWPLETTPPGTGPGGERARVQQASTLSRYGRRNRSRLFQLSPESPPCRTVD